MILKALYDLAYEEELAKDLDFTYQDVRFHICLDLNGKARMIDRAILIPPRMARGKPMVYVPPEKIPRRSGKTSGDKAEFLVEKCDYVFGCNPSLSGSKAEKLPKRAELFHEEVKLVLERTSVLGVEHKAIKALSNFLKQPPDERQALFMEKWAETRSESERNRLTSALFSFEYEASAPTPIHLLPEVMELWRSMRNRRHSEKERIQRRCLITGKECQPIDKHPPIRPVPGGNASGAALVSFNKGAFESYNLTRNENASISREAAEAYSNALNRLLSQKPLGSDGTPLERRNLQLSDDTVALFWARGNPLLDWVLEGLGSDTPDAVHTMLLTPRSGKKAPIQDTSAFFTLILTGAQGRSTVKAFLETSTQEAARAMERYLEDLALILPFKKSNRVLPLKDYLQSMAAQKEVKNLPPNLATEIYLAALWQRPLPHIILEAAIRRNRVERLTDDPKNVLAFAARCGLVKAYLKRNLKQEVKMSLDHENRMPAYLLGRLLAAFEKVQQEALGKVNASVIDRYYGSASSTPAAVFPTLIRRNHHHLSKLKKEKPGLSVNREKLIQEIACDLQSFKKTLTLEEQGLFALGFYHQRQDFFA